MRISLSISIALGFSLMACQEDNSWKKSYSSLKKAPATTTESTSSNVERATRAEPPVLEEPEEGVSYDLDEQLTLVCAEAPGMLANVPVVLQNVCQGAVPTDNLKLSIADPFKGEGVPPTIEATVLSEGGETTITVLSALRIEGFKPTDIMDQADKAYTYADLVIENSELNGQVEASNFTGALAPTGGASVGGILYQVTQEIDAGIITVDVAINWEMDFMALNEDSSVMVAKARMVEDVSPGIQSAILSNQAIVMLFDGTGTTLVRVGHTIADNSGRAETAEIGILKGNEAQLKNLYEFYNVN